MHIEATLPDDRTRVGILLMDRTKLAVVGKTDPRLRLGELMLGEYVLEQILDLPQDYETQQAYGPALMVFRHTIARRQVLAIHGGEMDEDERLLPTEGTLRMENEEFSLLLSFARMHPSLFLVIRTERIGIMRSLLRANVSQRPAPRVSSGPGYRFETKVPYESFDDNSGLPFWLWYYYLRSKHPEQVQVGGRTYNSPVAPTSPVSGGTTN